MKVPPFVDPKRIRWDTLQQVVRTVMQIVAALLVEDGLDDGEMFQAAIGGLASVIAWVWWGNWEFYRPAPPPETPEPVPVKEEGTTTTTVVTKTEKTPAPVSEEPQPKKKETKK